MNIKKIMFIILIVLVGILVMFVLSQDNTIPRIVNNNPIINNDSLLEETTTTTSFYFGELVNGYNEKEFGFSLKYPNELGVAQVQKSCKVDLYTKEYSYPPFISIYNPKCPSPFANVEAGTLEDYKMNYSLDEDKNISILKSEEIITISGMIGLKQEYTILRNVEVKGLNTDNIKPSLRYVFYKQPNQFYILEVVNKHVHESELDSSYKILEKEIINTIKF